MLPRYNRFFPDYRKSEFNRRVGCWFEQQGYGDAVEAGSRWKIQLPGLHQRFQNFISSPRSTSISHQNQNLSERCQINFLPSGQICSRKS